jgi:hypothetical protein
MIAQVQIDAISRPIITSLTIQPACQKSDHTERLVASSGRAEDSMDILSLRMGAGAAGPRMSPIAPVERSLPDITPRAVAAFSVRILVKPRRAGK